MPRLNKNRRAALQRLINASDLDELTTILEKLDNATRSVVLDAIQRKITATSKAAAVNGVKGAVQVADGEVREWLTKNLLRSYTAGMNTAASDLKKTGVQVGSTNVTVGAVTSAASLSIHKDAVNALISEAYIDFGNGLNGIVRGAQRQISEAAKRQIRAEVVAGQLTGKSVRDVAKEIRGVIGQQGFSVLIDRGGRSWTVKRYGHMLARTHLIKSANEGAINRFGEHGVDIVEISSHGATDAICAPEEGMIYSISGEHPDYPKLELYPPFHPNCRHTLLPRPDIG